MDPVRHHACRAGSDCVRAECDDRGVLDRLRGGPATISPTAYYTGLVWERHGLGVDGLTPAAGRALYLLGQPVLGTVERLGGPTLEHFLLARHRIIDRLLDTRSAPDGWGRSSSSLPG